MNDQTTATKIKFVAGLLLVLFVCGGLYWLYHNKEVPVVATPIVTPATPLPITPQVINTHTETIREITVAPAPAGNIFQFTEREGKQFVTINGKDYQLATTPGSPEVKVGVNGQIVMETQTTAKLDITDTVRAQVNDQLAVQAAAIRAENEKKAAKIRTQNTVEKVALTIVGIGVGYAVGHAIAK